jgi:hypothetical protein
VFPTLVQLFASKARLKQPSIKKSRKCDRCIPEEGMKINWFERNSDSMNSTTWLRVKKTKANKSSRYLRVLRSK